MKTLVIYYSCHHGNTKKLLDAVAECGDVTLADAAENITNISRYDLIGFASGIYYGEFAMQVLQKAAMLELAGKRAFIMYTCGVRQKKYGREIKEILARKGAQFVGEFYCRGYDTFGPFKLIGGIAKGRPGEKDIEAAKNFYSSLTVDSSVSR